jgi:hypothetical protein
MARVEAVAQGSRGMLQFGSWRDEGSNRLVGLSMWESREAFEAALPRITSLSGERKADWTERPDDVLRLTGPRISEG